MSTDRRFEQELPGLLDELYMGPMPAYRDHVLRLTAHTRQRPAWSFLSRWLPAVEVVGRPVQWRSIGLMVLLAGIMLALLAALIAGSQRRVPAPFGLARAGLVAYEMDGDIYTVDPATGASAAVVTGPETDRDPQWSRDGTRFAFIRNAFGGVGTPALYVARADGTDLNVVASGAPPITGLHGFSPDGSEILLTVQVDLTTKIAIVKSDGSGSPRVLDLGTRGAAAGDAGPSWRPPDGAEILFADGEVSLHAVNLETGVVRTIVGPSVGRYRGTPKWSPDGSKIAYIEWVSANEITAQVRVIEADGTGDRQLPIPPDAVWQAFRNWSNDGTRLLAIRGYTGSYEGSVAVVLPVDGSGPGIEIDYSGIIQTACCPEWEWAPDDSSILGTAPDLRGLPLTQVLLDPLRGTATAVPWTTSSDPTWQRLAP